MTLFNKNIFFGLNDVGKTNFLYALWDVFDKDIRKLNLVDSDFHNKQLDKPIEIIVTLDISDDIDYVLNVIHIDSYIDLYSLFKKNVS